MGEWLDEDGYPTEEALRKLEDWPYQDVPGALDFMKSLWHWGDDWCNHDISAHEAAVLHAGPDDKFLRCATGGWSGNESLIAAFEGDHIEHSDKDRWINAMLRNRVWRMSARGGLHIYQYETLEP